MKKNLEVIVQSINPEIPETAASFSGVLTMDHDEESLKLQHGTLYVVYSYISPVEIETSFVHKVVTDVLHNTYYTSQSTSPIQPLEKAALELKEKFNQTTSGDAVVDVEFNIVMAVVWGEVLYIVSYGKSGLYLLRENVLKEIDSVSEGSFSIASGLVKDMDIVFFGTQYFCEQFSPESVFKATTPILQSQLDIKSAALVLKFSVSTEFSQDESIEIMDPVAPMNIKKESDKSSTKIKKELFKLRPSQTSRRKKIAGIVVFVTLLIAFGASVASLKKSNEEDQKQKYFENLIEKTKKLLSKEKLDTEDLKSLKNAESELAKAEKNPAVAGVSDKIEEALNLKRVDSTLFYDLLLADRAVVADEIVFTGDGLAVSDSKNGVLYTSTLDVAKFTKTASSFKNINNLGVEASESTTATDLLSFSDSTSYKTYNTDTSKVEDTYALQTTGLLYPYLDFVYEIEGIKLNKYTKGSAGNLTSSLWVEDESLENAVSFTIDGSIYVLLKDGTMNKYTSGERDAFMFVDFDVELKNPSRVYSTPDFENMYILDTGNKRVVQIDKKGKFLAQYMDSDDKWTDLRDITVSADEKILYVLSGSKVFEVEL